MKILAWVIIIVVMGSFLTFIALGIIGDYGLVKGLVITVCLYITIPAFFWALTEVF